MTIRLAIINTLLLCLSHTILAKQDSTQTKDSLDRSPLFELSFGQSVLFISDAKQKSILKQRSIIVPASAILFFAEFRPEKKIKIPVFFNLPTESKQYIQPDGSLRNERANPSFGSGIQFRLFDINVKNLLTMHAEAGVLLSCITDFESEFLVAPLLAGRIRIRKGDSFVMYLGGSYTPGLNAFGVLYGTGTYF